MLGFGPWTRVRREPEEIVGNCTGNSFWLQARQFAARGRHSMKVFSKRGRTSLKVICDALAIRCSGENSSQGPHNEGFASIGPIDRLFVRCLSGRSLIGWPSMRCRQLTRLICGVAILSIACLSHSQTTPLLLELNGIGTDWISLTVSGSSSTNFTIELSNDLRTWAPLASIRTQAGPVSLFDRSGSIAAGGSRFYRAKTLGLSVEQAAWLAHGASSYTYHFNQRCFCIPLTPKEADVTVIDGKVVSATNVIYVPSPDPSEHPPSSPDLSQFKTIDDFFGIIQSALSQPADVLAVSYDPFLSFPNRISIDWWLPTVDDEIEYEIINVKPLVDATTLQHEGAIPSVEPTATYRGFRHQVTVNSATPSRWLLSRLSRRRSALELSGSFFQVAVAPLFRSAYLASGTVARRQQE